MELSEALSEALAPYIDVTFKASVFDTLTGKKFTKFNINRRGTVFQYTAPYPSLDEKFNDEFVKKVLREL